MTEQALISCIVVNYNGERFIAEAIDSLRAQSWRPIEIIVADDGSTDSSREIVAGYGDAVRLVTQDNTGPAATRNLGLAAATGEYVAFIDADDRWHVDKLTRQMACLEGPSAPEVCVTNVQHFWMPELSHEEVELREQPRGNIVAGYVAGTLLAPRSIFERVGNFSTDFWFHDGAEWFMRAEGKGVQVGHIEEVLSYHRMHERNLTRRRADESRAEALALVGLKLQLRRKMEGSTQSAAPRTDDASKKSN